MRGRIPATVSLLSLDSAASQVDVRRWTADGSTIPHAEVCAVTRRLRFALLLGGLLALLMGAGPVAAAGEGAAYGSCVAHHATVDGGFSKDHNPGMHRGFAGWTTCAD